MYITLTEAKNHINVDFDFHEDDNYIMGLIKAAEEAVSLRIDRKLSDTLIDEQLPDSIRHAVLLLMANWYANREPIALTSANPMPYTFDFLADLNKHYEFV